MLQGMRSHLLDGFHPPPKRRNSTPSTEPESVGRFRVHLISDLDCRRERLQRLIDSGATGVCVPLTRTRMAIQSAVDEAVKLGLAIFGWIEVGRDESAAHQVRRLVEAYPNLDGYFLHGIQFIRTGNTAEPNERAGLLAAESIDTAQQLLPGFSLIPVLDYAPELMSSNSRVLAKALEHQPRVVFRADSAASIRDSFQRFRTLAPEADLIVVLMGQDAKEGELDERVAKAESEGADGVLIAHIPIAPLVKSSAFVEGDVSLSPAPGNRR